MRGALLGCGRAGTGHLMGAQAVAGIEITHAVDPSASRRAAFAVAFPQVATVATLDDLPWSQVEFVDICAPPATHARAIVLCLERDVGVLCEKPLVLSARELDALDEAEQDSAGFLYPCQNYLFDPAVSELRSLLGSLEGHPVVGRFCVERVGHGTGIADWRPDWRRIAELSGGGVLQDFGPHMVYLAVALLQGLPSAVACRLTYPAAGPYRDTEDRALLRIAFAEGGLCEVDLNWASAANRHTYAFYGPWGAVALVDDRLETRIGAVEKSQHVRSALDDPYHAAAYRGMWEHFLGVHDDLGALAALRLQATSAVRVIETAYTSALEGGSWMPLAAMAP